MATAESVKSKLQRLVDALNQATGGKETTFVNALIRFLIAVDKPDPVLESLTVTENGSYTPSDGVTGYNLVEVDVQPSLEALNATSNGYYTPSPGYSGFEYVDVNVYPALETLDVTENGDYSPSPGFDGYSTVHVEVDTSIAYSDGYNTGYAEGYEAGRNSVETA